MKGRILLSRQTFPSHCITEEASFLTVVILALTPLPAFLFKS